MHVRYSCYGDKEASIYYLHSVTNHSIHPSRETHCKAFKGDDAALEVMQMMMLSFPLNNFPEVKPLSSQLVLAELLSFTLVAVFISIGIKFL